MSNKHLVPGYARVASLSATSNAVLRISNDVSGHNSPHFRPNIRHKGARLMITPWGQSQHQHKITDGVNEVDTAGQAGSLIRTAASTRLLSPASSVKSWKSRILIAS